eukprot:1076019-Pyramimonas_sp.AAC.1
MSKTAQEAPKTAPGRPERPQRALQDGLKGLRTAEESSKTARDGPPEGPARIPREPQEGHRRSPRAPPEGPNTAQARHDDLR